MVVTGTVIDLDALDVNRSTAKLPLDQIVNVFVTRALLGLQRDNLIRGSRREGFIELRKATHLNARNYVLWHHLTRPTLMELTFGEITPQCALIA